MEKVRRYLIDADLCKKVATTFLAVVLLVYPFHLLKADVIFGHAQADAPEINDGEEYPESRFGSGPMRANTGVKQGYANQALNDAATANSDGVPQNNSRSPASVGDSVMTSSADAISRKGVQEVAVIASDLGFFPKTVFVSRDVPVRLYVTGSSKNTLCIMMDSFQVKKQIRSQKIEEITFTPNMPGSYRFYCPVNGMEGTMIVKELASSSPAVAPAPRVPASVDPNADQ